MTLPESMAQSVYDIAGSTFYMNTADAEAASRVPADFFTLEQGAGPISLESARVEGIAKALRPDVSAAVQLYGQCTLVGGGQDAAPIVLDLGPLLQSAQGWSGGIMGQAGGLLGPAGGVMGGVALVGAHWAAVSSGGSTVKLVDKEGVAITAALLAADRLSWVFSFIAVSD